MQGQLPPGITLVSADNFETWLLDIQVLDANPLYAGETYRLKFMFSQNYPIEVRLHDPSCSMRRMSKRRTSAYLPRG